MRNRDVARLQRSASAICAATAIAAFVLATTSARPAKAKPPRVNAPASGVYAGRAGKGKKLTLLIAGKSVQLASFQFGCGKALGTANLDDIPLEKTKDGYKFRISAHGSVGYSDKRPDENAAVAINGQFDPAGKSVRGTLSVNSPRCGKSGSVAWSAKR